jgi:C1A family cysteine protease
MRELLGNNSFIQDLRQTPFMQSLENNPIAKSLENNPALKSAGAYLEAEYSNVLASMINGLSVIDVTLNGVKYSFKLNNIKSIISSSDTMYSQIANLGAALPNVLDLRPKLLPIRNQGNVNSCVAFSSSCMKEFEAQTTSYLSPSFIYHLRDKPAENDCMTIKNAMDILTNYGVCYEDTYSYQTVRSNAVIPKNAYNEATSFTIYSYALINTMTELKDALQNYGPCLIAFPVYNFSNQIWVKNEGDVMKGGHCMTVVGFDENSFIIRNTWGTDWADHGYTNYPYSQWGSHWEIWTCTNFSSLPPPIAPTLPPTLAPTLPPKLPLFPKTVSFNQLIGISITVFFLTIIILFLLIKMFRK